jgi:hypothetical protein
MAEIEEAVVDILTNDGGVSALIGTRCYPYLVPQDQALPAVAYQKISGSPFYAHDGEAGLSQARIQINNVDDDYAGAKALARAVRSALSAYTGTAATVKLDGAFLQIEVDGFGEGNQIYVVRQDYLITFEE